MRLRPTTWHAPPDAPAGPLSGSVGNPEPPGQAGENHPKVVAHLLNGRLVKGFALEVRPWQPVCLLRPRMAQTPAVVLQVPLTDAKALFFVKEFDGNPGYREVAGASRPSLLGRPVRVQFRDGELLQGTTPSRDLAEPGFFVVPMDPRSNNRRIFVVRVNVADCRFEEE